MAIMQDIAAGVPDWLWSNRMAVWFYCFCSFLVLLAFLEARMPAFGQPPQREHRWPTNFGLGFINILLVTLAPITAVLAAQWAQDNGTGLFNAIATPWWIATIATVVVRSLAGYLLHVVLHKAPLLWPVHRVHHADTHLDVSTAIRSHPLELVLLFCTTVPLAVLLGFDPVALIVYESAEAVWALVHHANIRFPDRLDRVLRWFVVTPNMHCLHHSAWHRETDSNYGQLFSVWDRLFGTYSTAPRNGYDAMQIGLNEIRDERAWRFWWQLKSPAIGVKRAPKDTAGG